MKAAPNAFKLYYLQNLLPSALRAMAGYHARQPGSYLCPRSRAWVTLCDIGKQNEVFNVGGLILTENMEKLVNYIFPDILDEARACFKAFRLRGTESAVPGAVASESNMLLSEALVYCAVLWLQVLINRIFV